MYINPVWADVIEDEEKSSEAKTPHHELRDAVASLAAREMAKVGIGGASEMEGLVYLTILITGTWSTAGALLLPRVLGFTADPARRRAVLIGANGLTEALARLLAAAGRTTLAVDAVSWRLDRFRAAGLLTVVGDARDAAAYEEAGVERDSLVVAGTTNDELNLLVAELVRAEFGVEHPVVALQAPPDELGRRSRAWIDLLETHPGQKPRHDPRDRQCNEKQRGRVGQRPHRPASRASRARLRAAPQR